jgi:hypothetical protein
VDLRAQRAAENENLFRRINERVEELSAERATLELVCECADGTCVDRIVGVPREEYEAVRAHADRFVVARGHERLEIERVVGQRGAYLVVEKQGEAAEIVRADDPRSE